MFNVRPRFSLHRLSFAPVATLLLALFGAFGAINSQAQVISNTFALAVTADRAMEGEQTARIMVIRNTGLRGKIAVDLAITNDPGKYGPAGLTTNLVFNDYQLSSTVLIPITDNTTTNTNSASQGITFEIKNPTLVPGQDPSLTPTIAIGKNKMVLDVYDDDLPQTISVQRINSTVNEGGTLSLDVKLGAPAAQADLATISVDFEVRVADPAEVAPGADIATVGGDPANPGPRDDLTVLTGTLSFNSQGLATIQVPVLSDQFVEFNEEFIIELSNPQGTMDDPGSTNDADRIDYAVNAASYARGRIQFNTNFFSHPMPAGAVDQRFNPDNVPPLRLRNPGANGPVTAVARDNENRYFVAGNFSAVNAFTRHGLARLTSTGSVDQAFVPAQNINGGVNALGVYVNGPQRDKVVIGGGFTSVSGEPRSSIARYLQNGSLDPNFAIGLGADGPIYAIQVEKDNSMIIGGSFSTFDGVPRGNIARLLPDGSLDTTTFNGAGANGPVFDLAIEHAPAFTMSANDTNTTNIVTVSQNTTARMGLVLLTYNTFFEPDRITIRFGGQTVFNRVFQSVINFTTNPTTGEITSNSVPATIQVDLGPLTTTPNLLEISMGTAIDTNESSWSFSAVVEPALTLTAAAVGNFTSYDGVPVNGVVKTDPDGALNATFANNIGTGANGPIQAIDYQTDGSYIIGGTFQTFNSQPVAGIAKLSSLGVPDLTFASGSGVNGAVRDIFVDRFENDATRQDKIYVAGDFTIYNTSRRIFLARLHPEGFLDTGFMDSAFNQYAGFPNLQGFEPDGTVGAILVDTNGAVLVGGRFDLVGGGPTRDSVKPRQNFARLVGGTTRGPGNITFDELSFGGDEDGTAIVLNFSLVDNSTYPPATDGDVQVADGNVFVVTRNGSAIAGQDYQSLSNNVSITAGTTNYFREVTIIDDEVIEGDEELFVDFRNILGTKNLGGEIIHPELALGEIFSAPARIVENDVPPAIFSFSTPEYNVDENRTTATIDIYRTGNIAERVTVDFSALVSTNANKASTPEDFVSINQQTLVFASGVTNIPVTVTIRDDVIVEVDETVSLSLTGASTGSKIDTNAVTAVLNIVDNDLPAGKIDFSLAGFTVVEGQPNAIVTLVRSGGNLGFIAVDYSTADDTATNGLDYVATSGRVSWNDRDIAPRTILIPILDDGAVEPLERFRIALSNPSQPGIIGTRNPTTFVNIADNDFFGRLQFSASQYFADENGTGAIIQVIRRDGSAETVSVNFATSPGTNAATAAVVNKDYTNVTGTLTFGPGETAKTFVVPIADDLDADGPRDIRVTLSTPVNGGIASSNAVVTIIDNEIENIPAGGVDTDFATIVGANAAVNAVAVHIETNNVGRKILIAGEFTQVENINRERIARLNENGTLDRDFASNTRLDGAVNAVLVLPDGAIMIGGSFHNVDTTTSKFVARLNLVGHYDSSFKGGAGPNNIVYALARTFAGNPTNNLQRILIGGDFVSFDSVQRNRIAMIGVDGSLDLNFNPGQGPNSTVTAIAVQRDQKILIGGAFTMVAGVPRAYIARLNADGTLDASFNPGEGFDGPVRTIVIQGDDKILVGGDFNVFDGQAASRLARLELNGQRDATFNIGTGADGPVASIALQTDGKIVLGGNFLRFNNLVRPHLVRLLQSGAVDLSINFGAGPNEVVNSVAIQSNRGILIGGDFTEVDGLPRGRVARVYGGSFAGSGELEFAEPVYTFNEGFGLAQIQVRRSGGMEGTVSATFFTSPITATPDEDYTEVTNVVTFQPGETFRSVFIPINDDFLAEPIEFLLVSLRDPIGGGIGRQPVTTIGIVSDDSRISIEKDVYVLSEDVQGGRANIKIVREGVASSPISVRFFTQDGTATGGVDYTAVDTVLVFAPGETEKLVSVPFLDEEDVEPDETVILNLALVNPTGSESLGRATAELTIANDDSAPGTIEFSGTTVVDESAGTITLTVTRSSGRSGTVSVMYATEDVTAQAPLDYGARNGILSFQQTDTEKTIVIPIVNDEEVEGNESFRVRLTAPTGGALLGPASVATVTIVDNDFGPGSLDESFDIGAGVGGRTVYAMVRQPDDKIVIGGDFTTFDAATARNMARVLPTGARDDSFSVGNGPETGTGNGVFALALAEQGRITVGGKFRSFASQDELFITRVTTNGTLDTTMSFSADLNDAVRAIAKQPDTKVVVGGAFTFPTARAARINASGSLDVSFNVGLGANNEVFDAQVLPDGKVLLGGAFTDFGGVPRGRVVRLLPNGLVDQTFLTNTVNNGANGAVRRIFPLSDGKILVAGNFTSFNGQSNVRIVRLNTDGSVDSTFTRGSGPNAVVNAIAVQTDGKVLIAGDFTSVDGQVRNRIARLNADGTLDDTFKPGLGPNRAVYDIELQPDGKILIAGAFTEVNGFPRSGLARLNTDAAVTEPFPITSFQVVGGDLQLTFASQSGVDYEIQESTDLNSGVWTTIRTITATGPTTTATGLPTGGQTRFFRVVVAP